MWGEFEQPLGVLAPIAQSDWAFDGLGDVGDGSFVPAADLVAEEPEAPERASADGALGDHAAARAFTPGRGLLDNEAPLGRVHLQRRVVEVATIAVLAPGRKPLEHLSVQADGVSAGAER